MSPRLLGAVGLLLASCAWSSPDAPHYRPVQLGPGLRVVDLVVPDKGAQVASGDTVALHYELLLADRTLVESSQDSGQALRFEVGAGSVPRGLEQGVIGMRLFGRRRIDVPSELAFGSTGRPPRIPPDAAVVFEVELMEHTPAGR